MRTPCQAELLLQGRDARGKRRKAAWTALRVAVLGAVETTVSSLSSATAHTPSQQWKPITGRMVSSGHPSMINLTANQGRCGQVPKPETMPTRRLPVARVSATLQPSGPFSSKPPAPQVRAWAAHRRRCASRRWSTADGQSPWPRPATSGCVGSGCCSACFHGQGVHARDAGLGCLGWPRRIEGGGRLAGPMTAERKMRLSLSHIATPRHARRCPSNLRKRSRPRSETTTTRLS